MGENDNALIDSVHQSAPMTAKLLEKARNRDERSIFSVACAKRGNGLVNGGSSAKAFDFSAGFDELSDGNFASGFFVAESTLLTLGGSGFV